MPVRFAALVLFVFTPQLLLAQNQRVHDVTVDDYFSQADIFDARISPAGRHVACVIGSWQKSSDDRKNDLWLVDTESKQIRKLTFDRANDRSVHWTRDGKHLYFLGNRKRGSEKAPYDGTTQIWRLALDGGEPFAVTRVEGGVEMFALDRNDSVLYYLTSEKTTDAGPWNELKTRFGGIEYGHGVERYSRITRLDLLTWRSERICQENRVIRELALAPNGKTIALITTPDNTVVSFEGKSRVDLLDVASRKTSTLPEGAFRQEAASPYGWLEHLAWSPNSQRLAFNLIFDAYPSEIVVSEPASGVVSIIKRASEVFVHGYGTPLEWRTNDELCFLGDLKGRVRLMTLASFSRGAKDKFTAAEQYQISPRDTCTSFFSFSADGDQCAAVINSTTHLADVYLLKRFYDPTTGVRRFASDRLTNVNPQVDTWKLPRISTVDWKGANGDTVEGILELPADHERGKKIPLVVVIHGGPTTCSEYKLEYWIYGRTLLPANGYAVLLPNYRGSTGYGDKFLTDLIGKENNLDVEDILTGVDALIERGIADPDRLAVSGWSNGGYLTNCIISKTTRFKAAISGAGIVDAVMEWGSNDEPAYTMVFKQGFPWNAARAYHSASPTYNLDKIRTPTLIQVGANDERCPPGQSRMLYRALKEYVNVPTELLVFPGAGHGLSTYTHRRAKMEWDLAWLKRHVLDK